MTTPEQFQLIEEICKNIGFTVHPANEFVDRVVTDTRDKGRGNFYWEEKEGFLEFFRQYGQFKYEEGYETASR